MENKEKDHGASLAAVDTARSAEATSVAPHVDYMAECQRQAWYAADHPCGGLHRESCGLCDANADSLAKAFQRFLQPAWHPIETAPKDGTLALLCDLNADFGIPRRYVGRWHTRCVRGEDWSRWEDMEKHATMPTHWMPLPAPPVIGSGTE